MGFARACFSWVARALRATPQRVPASPVCSRGSWLLSRIVIFSSEACTSSRAGALPQLASHVWGGPAQTRDGFASSRLVDLGCAAPMAETKKKKKTKRERKERRFTPEQSYSSGAVVAGGSASRAAHA